MQETTKEMNAKEYCAAKNSHITREVTVRRFDESKLHIGTAYKVLQVYDDPVTGYGRKFLFNGILQSVKDHCKEIVLVFVVSYGDQHLGQALQCFIPLFLRQFIDLAEDIIHGRRSIPVIR